MRPKTVQRPRPPILIGGYVDAVLRRVATRGDGWLTYFYTPESFTRGWERIRAFAREAGRDPSALTATNQLAIYVCPSREQTAADMPQRLSTGGNVGQRRLRLSRRRSPRDAAHGGAGRPARRRRRRASRIARSHGVRPPPHGRLARGAQGLPPLPGRRPRGLRRRGGDTPPARQGP